MKKGSVLLIITSLVMLLLSAVTLVFAWFTIVEKTTNIIIYSGTVEIEYSFVRINEDNSETPVVSSINYKKVLPGDKFKYRLIVTNKGNIDALLTVSFNFSGSDDAKAAFTLNSGDDVYDFTNSLTIVDEMRLNPDVSTDPEKVSTFEYLFEIIFDSSYENQTFNQLATIESIVITLEQE